ncbi:tyrosine-type recombinase/integrase [Dactylosporangium sp. CS-047395]|uniref:tyrosine-type recombinase/integrase n=1 Tax=Dactylosporangium sp. CS-047395 TaxID=3239936 RepID=UPI003D8BD1D6
MNTTYDVRIWALEVYKGKRATTYHVAWVVDGQRKKETFKTSALAESFRSDLIVAARKGEAFECESGRPVSMLRNQQTMSWYEFACKFVDLKWPRVAATTRRTHAEAMTAITPAMFSTSRGKPDDKLIRKALSRWAFNTQQRDAENCPADVAAALKWVKKNTRPVSALANPEILRAVLGAISAKLDGKPGAPSVVSRRRKIFNGSIEYAVELKLLDANPLPALKWKPPKPVNSVDRRAVPNPVQARTLINAVRYEVPAGARLAAFFGCLYFAAMRPEEAVALTLSNLNLPEEGWGEFDFGNAEPHAGKEWTDSGENRDRRQLKQREVGERRTAPCPPELTALIHWHVDEFGTGAGGRLFVGERNKKELPKRTITDTWRLAREYAFTPEVQATPLAKRPYDLRHAAVSTWLNGGVPPTDVAEWAGQSVEILFRIYAACLDKGTEVLRRRVSAALGY